MGVETQATGAKEAIRPVQLVLRDPVPAAAWWEGAWVIPTGVCVGVLMVAAGVMVARWVKRRRLTACERGFGAMCRRLGLTRRESALVREIAGLVRRADEPGADGRVRGGSVGRIGPVEPRAAQVARQAANDSIARRGVAIEDVVEFRGGARRTAAEAIAMVRSAARAEQAKRAGEIEVKTAAAVNGLKDAVARDGQGVEAVVVLVSEEAFVRGAMAWMSRDGGGAGDRERVVRLQHKVFA